MAVHGTSFLRAERRVKRITTILKSTACEWFLIFLLLIDAVFSFLVTKFARYCELQIPCILCSRLDHVLGNEKPEFYRNLLCNSHRSEISSLISCHIHGKLAVGHGMCDDCLSSFSTKINSNPDMHRLFVGKLGVDPNPDKDLTPISMSSRWCSCCSKPRKLRQNVERLHQTPPATRVIKSDIPLSRHLNHQEGMKKIRRKSSGSAVTPRHAGKGVSDPLSHVGYSELKITSDSETEFLFSDDEDGSSVVRDMNDAKDDVRKPHDTKGLTPDVSSWYGLCELNWQQPNKKICCPLPELILLDDIASPSNTLELPGGVSPISHSLYPSAPTEPTSLFHMSPLFDSFEAPVGASPENSANGTRMTDVAHVTINQHEEILKLVNTTAADIKSDQVHVSPAPVDPTYGDSSDVCKLAICGKGGKASGFIAEQPIEKQLGRVRDALNLLLLQNSSAQGNNLSENNKSANVQGCGYEFQVSNDVTSNGIQTLQKSVLVERTESDGLESLDGSTVSEIEGESTIDWLKRQVEYDRRCMNALCKELDEERNAATVAANEAMAMITRLQEEKSALHMDALQYLRMMEEQAEYDMEELAKANDLMAEKEKLIQDLEADLEYYRLKYPDESMMEILSEENSKRENVNVNVENMNSGHIKDDVNVLYDSKYSEVSKGIHKPDFMVFSLSEFKDEKLYILQCLESLEKKLQLFARDGVVHDMSNGGCTEEADRVHNKGEVSVKEGNSVSCHMEANSFPLPKDSVFNGSLPVQEGSNASVGVDQVISKENKLVSNGKKYSTHIRNIDLVSLENEISDLNDRLEALEDDYNFLDHTFDLLQDGNEGLPFIQQIAHQLQEIRKIGMSKCQSLP